MPSAARTSPPIRQSAASATRSYAKATILTHCNTGALAAAGWEPLWESSRRPSTAARIFVCADETNRDSKAPA